MKYISIIFFAALLCLPLALSAQPLTFPTQSTDLNVGFGLENQNGTANPSTQPAPASRGCSKPNNLPELFSFASCLMTGGVIPFLVSLGLIMFLVGVVQYIASGDNEEKREAGRNLMIFGVVALFVMVSVWGFVKLLHTTFFSTPFEINNNSPIK